MWAAGLRVGGMDAEFEEAAKWLQVGGALILQMYVYIYMCIYIYICVYIYIYT